MALIDFKEIPKANIADGKQDIFELFAREFFTALGFSIVEDPDRGQDGGRDIIISESRTGIINDTEIRWLVSCKHKIHSGLSVNASDEEDISDRIQAHHCDGFIGFYSTIVSSPLNRKLEALKDKYEIQIFDREKIERILLENREANKLIRRFFPKSYSEIDLKSPSNLLSKYAPLRCKVCGKDLLHRDILDKYKGIVVFVQDMDYYECNDGYSCAAEPPVQYRLSHLSRRSEPLIKHTICMMRVYSRNALSNPYTSRMEISCSASMLVMLMR